MNFIFKGERIDYLYFGGKTETIMFLHGWGGGKNSFASTINLLKQKFNILSLTMPTISPTRLSWKLEDYACLVINLLNLYNCKNISIICHSFGFRVASLLSKQIKIDKMVVTGGAGLKFKNIFKRIENDNKKIFLRKWKFLYPSIASKDYISLTDENKITFKNIVNLNTKNFVTFSCPLLLFWGTGDKETPFSFAKYLKARNDAKLIKTKGGHFAYLNNNAYFNNEVVKFLTL